MKKQTAIEYLVEEISKLTGLNIQMDEPVVERAMEMEKQQKHKIIDEQVQILTDTLEEMMTGFDSEEDRMDFILDICNGYKKRICK